MLGKSGVTEKCLKVVHGGVWGQCNCRRDGGVQRGGGITSRLTDEGQQL